MDNKRKLADWLDDVRARVTARDAARVAYRDVLERLARSAAAEQVKRVGDRIAPFALPDADGRLVALDDLLARGPLVLTFFRGDWCPYCRVTMSALNAANHQIEASGGRLVGIVPDTGGIARQTQRSLGLQFPLLCDVDHGVATEFGLTFPMPDSYRQLLLGLGIDLELRHGHGGWFVPIPGCFVVDRSGVIRYAFADIDYTLRTEPAELPRLLACLADSPDGQSG